MGECKPTALAESIQRVAIKSTAKEKQKKKQQNIVVNVIEIEGKTSMITTKLKGKQSLNFERANGPNLFYGRNSIGRIIETPQHQ